MVVLRAARELGDVKLDAKSSPEPTILNLLNMLGIVSVPSWAIAVAVIAFCLFVLPELHLWIEKRQTARNPYRAAQAKLAVSALYVYPVKSLAGVAVSAHKVGARGFEFDRLWMVVDGDGVFITQRKVPKMALIQPGLPASADAPLVLDAPGLPTLTAPVTRAADAGAKPVGVTIWDDRCEAIDQGDEAGDWLARATGEAGARLVRMDEGYRRGLDPNFDRSEQGQTGFADGFPFLVVTEASLAELNARIAARAPGAVEPLPMDRFRPNVVVSGAAPFAEDAWAHVSIGREGASGLVMALVKPCSVRWRARGRGTRLRTDSRARLQRCSMPGIDQQTGERELTEPTKTLRTFRTGAALRLPQPEWKEEVRAPTRHRPRPRALTRRARLIRRCSSARTESISRRVARSRSATASRCSSATRGLRT